MAIDWEAESKRRIAARVGGMNRALAKMSSADWRLGSKESSEKVESRIEAAFKRGIEMDKQYEEWALQENCRWLLLEPEERAREVAEWIPRVQELIEDFATIRNPAMRYAMQSSFRKRLERLMNAVESDDSPLVM